MSPFRRILAYLLHTFLALLSCEAFCLKVSQMLAHLLPMKVTGQYGYFKVYKGLLYLYQMCMFLRMLHFNSRLLQLEASEASEREVLLYDPVLALFARQYGFFNQYTFALIGLLLLFSLYIDYSFCLQSDTLVVRMMADILVENVRNCRLATGEALSEIPAYSPRYWASVRQLTQFSDRISFSGAPLVTYPRISRRLRIRLVQQAVYSETLFGTLTLGTALISILILSWHLLVPLTCMSPGTRLLASLDLTLVVYSFFDAIRNGLFAVNCIYLISRLFKGQMVQLEASLWASGQAFEGKPTQRMSAHLDSVLRAFASERHSLYLLLEHLNRQLISNVVAVAFLTNILHNVVMLCLLLLQQMAPLERAFVLLAIALQGFFFFASEMLIPLSGSLYGAEGQLYRVQGTLGVPAEGGRHCGRALSSKLALLALFEVTCSKTKFTFTVGSISKISKRAVYEFLYAYSSFFMFTFKLMRKLQANQ